MAQGKKLSPNFWNKVFLEALELSVGNVSVACKATNITPQTYYQYRSKNPDFAKKARFLLDNVCLPYLEDIARSRAIQGNDRLLIFMLRNLGKRRWNRDKEYEAMAKESILRKKKDVYKKIKINQRPPTEAEIRAAEILNGEDDEDE